MTTAAISGLRRYQRAFDLMLLGICAAALWQLFFFIGGSIALASPWAAAKNAYAILNSASFWGNAQATLLAFGIAVAIELVAGIAIGIFLGLRRMTGDVVEPMLAGLYSIPKLMFFPIVTIFFGIGLSSAIVFGILHGIISIILFTMSAVRNIKLVYLKSGRVMNLSTSQMMLTIALPGALPEIFTGLRIGISGSLIGVILCELFGSSKGVGFLLMNAMENNITVDISAYTLILIAFAVLVSGLLMAVDERLHRRL
jgi:NitT/TauT family transport system permease protein